MLRANLHFALLFFAFGFIEFFGPVYFYKLGFPLHLIAFYWAGFFMMRLVFRPLVVLACQRLGFKRVFLAAVFFYTGRYLLYSQITESSSFLLLVLLYDALAGAAYWTLYHSYFAMLSSSERMGVEVAWRDSTHLVVRMISPVCAAFLIEHFGFKTGFFIAALVTLFSLVPLITSTLPERAIDPWSWRRIFESDRAGFWIFAVSAVHGMTHEFLWKLVLFIYLGSYLGYGGLLSLAVFFQVAGTFMVGRRFDLGKGLLAATFGSMIIGIVLASRVFCDLNVPLVIFLDLVAVVGGLLSGPFVSAFSYSRSKLSGNPLRYQFLSEGGWDIGACLGLSMCGLMLWLGGSMRPLMLLGLPGLAGLIVVLWKYRKIPG